MAQGKKTYPAEFKRRMVELVRAGRSPEELAKEFERFRDLNGSGESIRLGPGPGVQARVPCGRRCTAGEPSEAMGLKAPERRMVPALERSTNRLR